MVDKQTKINLPNITEKQKQILLYLYQFRFINTHQLQKLFNHKNPKRIQLWLKDLKDKTYIKRYAYKDSFESRTKPAVYFLGNKGRQFLKDDKNCSIEALKKIYKEETRKESFVSYCLSVVYIYLYFLKQKKENEEIRFFTESQLLTYDYFPNPLPSAYISVKGKDKTKRYFLEVFKDYANSNILRSKVKAYMQYVDERQWDEHAEGKQSPMVLFVCPTENLQKHISYYAKALFEKDYEEKFSLFVSSKARILNDNKIIWEKVKIEG